MSYGIFNSAWSSLVWILLNSERRLCCCDYGVLWHLQVKDDNWRVEAVLESTTTTCQSKTTNSHSIVRSDLCDILGIVSVFKMTRIVSAGALNSIHSHAVAKSCIPNFGVRRWSRSAMHGDFRCYNVRAKQRRRSKLAAARSCHWVTLSPLHTINRFSTLSQHLLQHSNNQQPQPQPADWRHISRRGENPVWKNHVEVTHTVVTHGYWIRDALKI